MGRHAFEPDSRERCVLVTINSTISGTLWSVRDRSIWEISDPICRHEQLVGLCRIPLPPPPVPNTDFELNA
jgi:hypothetical protein